MSEGKGQVRGELLVSPPMTVEWKVPGFFSLPKEQGHYISSPAFSYLDGTLFLKCYPNGQSHTSYGWIDLYLSRECSASVHTITYQLGIRREDGIEYTSCLSYTADFKAEGGGWGRTRITERASLLKDKRFVAPQDEITIFCTLRDRTNAVATSQTVLPEAADANTEISEEDFKNLENEVEGEEASHVPSGFDKLSQSLKDVFISGEHHDTIVKVKEEEFRTHKFILVVRSAVFASMFRHNTIECSTGVITIDDCDPNAFREFLSYMYSGKLENVCTENVLDLYFIADKYEVEEVKAECVKFMINNFSVDNFCDFISLALRHDERRLIKSATDYFTKNVKNIILTVKWQSFYKEHTVESNELFVKAITHLVPD